MADGSTDADLAELLEAIERTRLRALVEADIATADRLHAHDYQLITPGGVPMSEAAYLDAIADGMLRYRRFEPDGEVKMRVWGSASALRYEVDIEVVHDGTDTSTAAGTDIYELRDGRWMAVWSDATRIRSGTRQVLPG